MIRYVFKDEPVVLHNGEDADAQVIGDSLEEIRLGSGGELRPRAVVDAAKKPDHPLHPHFEWDNKKAAERYRLGQARGLIRAIRRVDDDEVPRRAFISIHDKGGTSYRSLGDVLASHDLQLRVWTKAEADLRAFESRYQDLTEICDLVAEARERLSERIAKQRERQDAQPSA